MLILLGAEACAPLLILTRAEVALVFLVKGSLMPLGENVLNEQMIELIRNHRGYALGEMKIWLLVQEFLTYSAQYT